MDDLISRQAAIDRINKQREHLEPDVYPQDKIGDAAYRICAEFIERLPSAQTEIVRCKDCEYYVETNGRIGTCELTISGAEDNGFCAWGERKDDGNRSQ